MVDTLVDLEADTRSSTSMYTITEEEARTAVDSEAALTEEISVAVLMEEARTEVDSEEALTEEISEAVLMVEASADIPAVATLTSTLTTDHTAEASEETSEAVPMDPEALTLAAADMGPALTDLPASAETLADTASEDTSRTLLVDSSRSPVEVDTEGIATREWTATMWDTLLASTAALRAARVRDTITQHPVMVDTTSRHLLCF